MKLTSLLSEAFRDVASGTARAVGLAFVVAGVTTFFGLVEGVAVNDIVADAQRYRAAGGSITIVSAEGGVDGSTCARLAGHAGVPHSGAIRLARRPLAISSLPSSNVALYEVTAGFLPMLGGSTAASTPAVFLSHQLAESLAVGNGDKLDTKQGAVTVGGVFPYPDDGRLATLQGAAVVEVAASGLFDECWIDTWPAARVGAHELTHVVSAVAPAETKVLVGQLNPRLGTDFDAQGRYERRPSRFMAMAGLVIGFAIGMLATWLRRLELAAALHCGVRRISLALQHAIETMTWACASVLIACPTLVYNSHRESRLDADVLWLQLKPPVAACAAALLGSFAAVMLVREQRLFHYFRSR